MDQQALMQFLSQIGGNAQSQPPMGAPGMGGPPQADPREAALAEAIMRFSQQGQQVPGGRPF